MVVIWVFGSVEDSQNDNSRNLLSRGCVPTAGSGALHRLFSRASSSSLGVFAVLICFCGSVFTAEGVLDTCAIMMKFYEESS